MKGVLLCLLVGFAAGQRDQGVEEYGTVMRTQCADGMLAVTIDYNLERVHSVITSTSARTLEKANITFGTSCQFENDHTHKYYHVATKFEKCNITAKHYDHGVRYDGVVFIRTGPPSNQAVSSYHVSCSFLYNSTASTRFEVYNRDDLYDLHTVKSVDTIYSEELKFTIYPVAMTVAKEFPLLFTYPARCFLDNYNGHSNPVTVLENGCPIFDDRKNFYLSAVFQPNGQVWSADTTEVRVVFGNHVLPDGKNSPITALRFGCDVFFCTSEQKHRIEGIPLCPSAAPCNSKPAAQSILSEQGVGGESKIKLVSAHLPVPINIQLDISGGYGPYKEPIPRSFPVNVTRPPITCVENGTPVYKFVLSTLVGMVVGCMIGIFLTKMTSRGGYLISESSNAFSAYLQNVFKRDTTRCGSAVSQAHAAPQPYVKLESSPPVLLSTDAETGSALA